MPMFVHSTLIFTLAARAAALDVAKPDGTCGYQCKSDSDCNGCGHSGKCSCPDGVNASFYQESCTCVSAPKDDVPQAPVDVKDAKWPEKWTANVDSWTYGDWSAKVSQAHGKFYYDATLGRTRVDWTPYINGHNARQVWVADVGKGTSKYYVATGPLCLYFSITDPGQAKKPLIGMVQPDWMSRCKDAGLAKYIGREQVEVAGSDEWVDHWSCRLDYAAANQSITFQNWHSLGLGQTVQGLPLRVTGGNSAPNPTKGSPRLNTVWYSNFTTGDHATGSNDFKVPDLGICIPVGAEETEAFFGHKVEAEHAFSPNFHQRASWLPHVKPSISDLQRARRPKPGPFYKGAGFTTAMQKLNSVLKKDTGLKTKPCTDFSFEQLHEMQRILFHARSPTLDNVYSGVDDKRRMAYGSLDDLEKDQVKHLDFHRVRPDLAGKARDGACHEMVMWYVHHLSASAREEIKSQLVLPLLPEVHHHEKPSPLDAQAQQVHGRYNQQTSCAICHVAPSSHLEPLLV